MKMKLLMPSFVLLAGLFAMTGCKDDLGPAFEPADKVAEAFVRMFPKAINVQWMSKNGYEVAYFSQNAQATTARQDKAWYTAGGDWRLTEMEITRSQLPAPVETAFSLSEYASWKVDDIDQVERPGFSVVYQIEVELEGQTDMELYYAEDGLLIKAVPDDDGSDDVNEPIEIPSQIAAYLSANHPRAQIMGFDKEEMRYEVLIVEDGLVKGVLFDLSYQWLMTMAQVRYEVLPEAVKMAYQGSEYYGLWEVDQCVMVSRKDGSVIYVIEIEQNDVERQLRYTSEGMLL